MTRDFSQMASAPQPQGEADVGVVEVVGRADRHEVDAVLFGAAAEFLEVPVEAFEFGEEAGVEGEAVEGADCVVGIGGGNEVIAGVGDGLHVARRHEAGGTDQGEVEGHAEWAAPSQEAKIIESWGGRGLAGQQCHERRDARGETWTPAHPDPPRRRPRHCRE